MKRMKGTKLLSVFLSVLMMLSVCGVALPSLVPQVKAVGPDTTDAQAAINTLASAMNNDTVRGIAYYGSANGYNSTLNDPDGNLLAFAEAYWAAYVAVANNTGSDQTTSYRTSTQVRSNRVFHHAVTNCF